MVKRPGGQLKQLFGDTSPSQLFPLLSNWPELRKKAFVGPILVTVIFVAAMFATQGSPVYFSLLAVYLSSGGYYFIYQLCGKRKPWWILVGVAVTTMILVGSPLLTPFVVVFRNILPGNVTSGMNGGFIARFIGMFFGAGLMEELLKALPVLGAYWLGLRMPPPQRDQVGVSEPLDGILLGAASAAGFALIETMGQYVPAVRHEVASQFGEGTGNFVGLQLLIPRAIAAVTGHMAYSGYFGYFIGLSVLHPASRWQILGVGYLSAAGLHALWNSAGVFGVVGLVGVGSLSYAFLAAAILKARQVSPTRSQNFATEFTDNRVGGRFSLRVGARTVALPLGIMLRERDIPGAEAQLGDGVVAEVSQNPHDPSILGLKNHSRGVWTVTSDSGARSISPGQSIRLAKGTKIDFGTAKGEIGELL